MLRYVIANKPGIYGLIGLNWMNNGWYIQVGSLPVWLLTWVCFKNSTDSLFGTIAMAKANSIK